jgi:ATP-dependent protease ClpP protease subunit
VNFDRRVVYISGEVDSTLAHKTIMALEALDQVDGEIRIVLNSDGGNEQDGYAIYDAITMCRNRVDIDGYGNVMSIAAAIFQAGDERRLAPNASFMIHHGTTPAEEEMKQDAVIDLARQLEKDNQRYYDALSFGSSQPQEIIQDWCREEKYFTAEEAVQVGFADSIIEPLKTKVPKRKRRRRK